MHCHSKGGEHMAPDLKPAEVTAAERAAANENETTEMWREHHAIQTARRAESRARNVAALNKAGIPYVSKNGGAHLIVAEAVDWWPGTGLWHSRTLPTKGYGLRSLLEFIGYKTAILSEVTHG